ncbi:hypothetical protein C6P45_003704 [Maudiozyma exigua]|uniref:Uncharacterized protein n=1 Tax=Maudiozyma exigua TaxID=34358 RepID=A0A9P6WEK8_MAUEX|nr:hypothetical protein C6P45_003704 [Kazachstania exigua]
MMSSSLSLSRMITRRIPLCISSGSIIRSVYVQKYNHGLRYYTSDVEQRYKDKLLENAKKLGFNSIEELKANLKDSIESKKKELNKIDPFKELEEYETRQNSATTTKSTKYVSGIDPNLKQAPYKKLDSYLNLDKISNLSPQQIEYLWRAKWGKNENVMSAVIPNEIFDKMYKYIRQNPVFVLPLPRKITGTETKESSSQEEGMELHYIQWQFVGPNTIHCMMTSLAEFKLHNQYARPHTTLEFFTDLSKEKEVVLMKGTIEPNSNIKSHDAQLLLLNIQRFYGALGEESAIAKKRIHLLESFTKATSEFKVDSLIELSQSMEN